ncbi:MAG: NAD-dependent epimerase/dehydratase family protein [Methylovirgula sp.]
MPVCVVTGSAGLIGSESVRRWAAEGYDVFGIDNDMRAQFFGEEASTRWNRERLEKEVKRYRHLTIDIRDFTAIDRLFADLGSNIACVIHTAAQPSHDWAVRDPHTDFGVNANGTLNVLEATRRHAPESPFIFTSTNKVYGDTPNHLPLIEMETRFELDPSHPFAEHGIDETMSIDRTLHSLFGASKVAADVLTQEYGRYFGMKTACFRGGCLTGPAHSGTELHGFLAYLVKCVVTGRPYTIYGYKAKQVRDNIHANDLIDAFWHFFKAPRAAEVYNMGGGRFANVSMMEAIELTKSISGRAFEMEYRPENRVGDHIWWIGSLERFRTHYPDWRPRYDIKTTIQEIVEAVRLREKQ